MNYCEFEEFTGKTTEIKKILNNKRSSQMPTVIRNKNENQIWLFFFKEKSLKILWIFDGYSEKWFRKRLFINASAACIYENNIYISDNKGKIYIKKKQEVIPPVKIYTSRNINSKSIITFFLKKGK